MDRCVGDMNMKEILVYIDDLIVFGKTLLETEERLIKTLTRLREFGLKVESLSNILDILFQKMVSNLIQVN